MTDDKTREARDEAEAMATKVPALLDKLAERLGANAGAKAVFGDPVEKDGVTVIPVAQSIVGTGGCGGGSSDPDQGSGLGAGGGAMAKPLGYIEVSAHGASFKPLTQPWMDAKLILAYTLLVLVLSRMLVKLIRG